MSVVALGYLVFEVADVEAWRQYGVDVLGLATAEGPDGELRLRADAAAWRIACRSGPLDDLAVMGLEVTGEAELFALEASLQARGVATTRGDAAQLGRRGVLGLVACRDPDGLEVELVYGLTRRTETPFVSPLGVRFLTGEQGLGHVVLSTRDMDGLRAFYVEGLGFRLADVISVPAGGDRRADLEFFYCNRRHHTLALAPFPSPKRMHHFMLQVDGVDAVGMALERIAAAGVPLAATLGRHTNDEMVSFYARTPSGFEVEFGYGALDIDEGWTVSRHEAMSAWGHKRLKTGLS